ncbi:GDP-L-fucose synthase family protein [Paenibacillus agricola]|uniref:GDP-L-fucose synthase n=1 Tax=Paenibacillus agricola TaxID=2716264 RepID=A0ABX0JEG4_9BACL|nr:GDP-L-fucose synthase [Paenibacillus agricola]NHN34283.1 GDP-L-fucose synthase [Paenibacillus agricola]
MNKSIKIYLAGHRGMVGKSIAKSLQDKGYNNVVGKSSKELDLTNQNDVESFFDLEKPECVILAAARVGGIGANISNPVDFLMDNLLIQSNVIKSAYNHKVRKLVFLGSSCIYPTNSPQPLKEEYLLSGYLEKTNEAYALAKIAGLKACEYYNSQYNVNFISMMPCNLYGKYDNFDLQFSHVVPALLRKIHEAKINNSPIVEVWGSGNQLRELMYVDDMAEATVFLMENYNEKEFINVGTGQEFTIKELVYIIKDIVGYKGEFHFDSSKPEGMQRKVLDVTKINNMGWKHKYDLRQGIEETYKWFLASK